MNELNIPQNEVGDYAMFVAVYLDDLSGANDPPAGSKSKNMQTSFLQNMN